MKAAGKWERRGNPLLSPAQPNPGNPPGPSPPLIKSLLKSQHRSSGF